MRRPSRDKLRRAAEALENTIWMSEESSISDHWTTRVAREEAAPDREAWREVTEWLYHLARGGRDG